ncbi:MAG: GreA/GreB family elongation factor, partial [Clostridia bacterium]|nr:GreA/GreB family elongation factor [Clostridia bacterium]
MDTRDKNTVSIGCKVRLFCLTDNERYEYKIVRSRDTTEFTPQFGGYHENQNYDSRAKIAEYAEDELGDDRPLAKELIGKKCGDTVKVFSYTYQIEDINFYDEYAIE